MLTGAYSNPDASIVDPGTGDSVGVTPSGEAKVLESNSADIKTASETLAGTVAGTEVQVDVVASLPAGTNTLGSVLVKDPTTGKAARVNTDGQLHIVAEGHLCTENSSTTPLDIDEVFTGTAENILAYNAISVFVTSDAAGSLAIQYSTDGTTNWRTAETYSIVADAEKWFTPPSFGVYLRLVYTNGGVAQTSFELTTVLRKVPFKWSSHNIEEPITDQDDGELVKSVITGKKANGDYDNVSLTNGGNMKISLEELEAGVSSNSNSQLNVTPFHADGTEGALISGVQYVAGKSGIDQSTNVLEYISYEHHEIHSGSHYFICDNTAFANGEVVDFTIVTPNTTKWTHLTFLVSANDGEASIEIYEGATVATTGTAVTAYNNNRNSANNSGMTIRTGDTFSATGTRFYNQHLGSGKIGGIIEREKELVLKQNTTYIYRITNETTLANNISYCAEWYEHIDKN